MAALKTSTTADATRILVRLTGTLGDALVSLPALRALRAHFGPSAEFHLLHDGHPDRTPLPEFFECEPFFTQNFGYPKSKKLPGKLSSLTTLAARLRKQHYAAAVLITSCTLSRWTVQAERRFLRLCGIKRFIGFEPPQTEMMLPHDTAGRAVEADRDLFWRLRRLAASGIAVEKFIPQSEPFFRPEAKILAQADSWLRAHKLKPGEFWAVAPFTGSHAKDWPPEYWQELLAALSIKAALPLVILGLKTQHATAEKLAARWSGPVHNTCGEVSVALALGILSRAHHFIGMDALPAHAAGAMGVPGVVIFISPSHPGQWLPWSPPGQLLILRPKGKLPEFTSTSQPAPDDPRLQNLRPQDVLEALTSLSISSST